MKKKLFTLFICLYLTTGALWSFPSASNVKADINWPAFMQKQDPIWDVLPEHWYESAFMGNGMLGLMIYKEPDANYLRLETGHCAVHDHRPGAGLFNNPRLLTGHFALRPQGDILNGTMRLDLWNAETHVQINTTRGTIALRALVHANEMAIIVQTNATEGEKNFRWEWVPAQAQSPRYLYAHTPAGSWITPPADYLPNPQPELPALGLSVQRLNAGGETAVVWETTHDRNGHERTWLITIAHTYPQQTAVQEAERALQPVKSQKLKSLLKAHRHWWHNYYPKSFLTLPDGMKENFYWMQMYKLACATRADRALIDNTGPWLTVTPWPNAWWNLNVQLTYWPLNASNHLDLAASLENALYGNTDNLRRNVPAPYRTNSLAINRSSNLECVSGEVGIPGVSPNAEIGLLTWACHNLWLIYRYKMDDELLRHRLYPLLKQSVNYYLHFLRKEDDGLWHLPATYSPEYGSAEDCNFDLALLRWGCQTLLHATERLSIDDEPLISHWKDVLENLTPYPSHSDQGLMIGRNTPYTFSHRHYSHLIAAYPLYLINRENPEEQVLIERSLAHWQSKPEALRGYSFTGASSLSSALGKGDDALNYLNRLFDSYLSVNTLYRESGPVIETPLSAAQSIHDMLLQSWGGKIRIFPAVPHTWQDLAFHDFRAEGAFLVSARRQKGKTAFVSIRSLAGEPCTVVTDIIHPVFRGKHSPKVTRLAEQTYKIDLRKGEEVLICAEENIGEAPVIVPMENEQKNCFGKKKP